MMKATGFKRGSRKKQQPQPQPQPKQHQPKQQQQQQPGSHQDRPREQRPQVVTQHTANGSQVRLAPEQPQQHQKQQYDKTMMRRSSCQWREPPPEQVELTKKNYRLAKELSELRVRHREENKNVARLTMENMNLASRCREAISHVAMLKKELSMHQKRAQEALKLQREQTQRMASNLSAEASRLSQSNSNDSNSPNGSATSSPERLGQGEMERVLSSMEPPPPPPPRKIGNVTPPRPTSVVIEHPTETIEEENYKAVDPQGELENDAVVAVSSDEDETVEETRHGRSVLDVVESLSDLSSPPKKNGSELPPRVFSTPNRKRKEDRWTPNIDAEPGSVGKNADGTGLFPHSASPKVVGPNNKSRNYNEEFPMDIVPNQSQRSSRTCSHSDDDEDEDEKSQGSGSPHKSLLDRHSGMITINSIDAFEASFDTTFPSTFANREGGPPKASRGSPRSSDIYNPFEPSPARSTRWSPSTPPKRDASHTPPSGGTLEIVRKARVSDSAPFGTPERQDVQPPRKEDLQYATPPKERCSPEGYDSYGEPSRPHKTASAEARKRYEKALQPRSGSINDSSQASLTTTDAVAPEKEEKKNGFSPGRLFKRIHQRRKHKEEKHQQQEIQEDVPQTLLASSNEQEGYAQHSPSESSMAENVQPDQYSSPTSSGSKSGRSESMEPRGVAAYEVSSRSNGSSNSRSTPELRFDETESDDIPAGRPGGMVARLNSLKHYQSRRTVKQPVSYAEPALNTKIRQGHTFFPKQDADDRPQIVTPEAHFPPTSAAV